MPIASSKPSPCQRPCTLGAAFSGLFSSTSKNPGQPCCHLRLRLMTDYIFQGNRPEHLHLHIPVISSQASLQQNAHCHEQLLFPVLAENILSCKPWMFFQIGNIDVVLHSFSPSVNPSPIPTGQSQGAVDATIAPSLPAPGSEHHPGMRMVSLYPVLSFPKRLMHIHQNKSLKHKVCTLTGLAQ